MALNIIGRTFGWLGRRLLLYVVLVCAIGFATFALPWIKREIDGDRQAQQRYEALDISRRQLDRDIDAARRAVGRSTIEARRQGVAAIDARIATASREKAALERASRGSPSTFALALRGRDALLAAKRRELRVLMLDREIGGLRATRSLALAERANIAAVTDLQAQRAVAQAAIRDCDNARGDLDRFEQRWRWRVRSWLDNDEHRALAARTASACADARRQVGRHNLLARTSREAALARARAQALLAGSEAEAGVQLVAWQARLAADAERARTEWAGNWSERARLWADRMGLRPILIAAGWALIAILLTPYAIRLIFFFLLAPMAMRRAAIRVSVPGGGGTAIPLPGPSTTSVAIRLDRGEELLVRQDYLQSTSHDGAKATRWLLDHRHPLSSLVSGLAFLTRIRGDGELTTISAVRDPFAETVVMSLPEGAACVLQPRALAAVAQPIGRPLRISSHWRLFSLNAWLTLQLRYLVFHGPARLVLKGGRGVRVERAEQGRVFGQDQLVGFSADLAYSVTRTETFWPYFLGREQLFKDRVEAGDGLLIVEEAPMAGRGRGEARRGLEGAADAMLKLVGL